MHTARYTYCRSKSMRFHLLPSEEENLDLLINLRPDFSIFRHSYAPVFRKEEVLNFAISDPAALHATLVHSALNVINRFICPPILSSRIYWLGANSSFRIALPLVRSSKQLLIRSQLSSLRQDAPGLDMFYHMGEAIRLINERIRNPADLVASDATIFAVACMTHLEVCPSPQPFIV